MTICLNSACLKPHNPDNALYCQNCGAGLRLHHRYQAVQVLGQGGFGRTFLAVDLGEPASASVLVSETASETLCVIKQLLPQASPERQMAYFQQEVAQLTRLGQHPQIPRLLAHFSDQSGQYLIQEYIAGQNLEAALAKATFSEVQIRQLLADLLPVLRFMHSQQVIHRDIKPANVIYSTVINRYVLVDFGAAKSICETVKTGTMIGSAGYVAPEQAMGKATYASDLYSLGITCIHLLTGMHPFDLYSVSEDRWIWKQYLAQPISSELRRVLDRLLQRATSQRYANPTAVLQALRLENEKIPVAVGQSAPVSVSASVPLSSPTVVWHGLQTLTGHQGEVTSLALSPDGQLIASGSTDKTIRLWSLQTGELLYVWAGRSFRFAAGHRDGVTALAFSPSSEVLVSSSADGTIKQWDLDSGELIGSLPGHGWGIATIALHPDQPLLASGSIDGLIQLWDLNTDQLIANIAQSQQPVTALVIDPMGQTLWGSSDKTISQWDLQNDRRLTVLKGHAESVSAIALSWDGCTLVSGGADRLLKLWNLSTGQQQKVIAAHRQRIRAVVAHPTQPCFASASEDSTIKLWDMWTGERLCTLRHAWGVNTIAFSSNGELLVSGSADETIRIWQKE
jgi:serine/threonine protein kinase